jgi:DNA-binding CsgD family transcriptional regulator
VTGGDSSQARQWHGLDEADARALVRMLGQAIALPGGHEAKKRFLLAGTARLVRADWWAWVLQRRPGEDARPEVVASLHDDEADGKPARLQHGCMLPEQDPNLFPVFCARGEPPSPFVSFPKGPPRAQQIAGFRRSSPQESDGIGPLMLASCPLDARSVSMIALYRRTGAAPFTPREQKISRLIMEEVPWLHRTDWPESRPPEAGGLSPRQRTILALLLKGHSRKQIAYRLEITENTVAGYCREIYRRHAVNSHAELIHKFLTGKQPPPHDPPP